MMQNAILPGDNNKNDPDIWVKAKSEFSAKDQLAVYVNAYRFRLYDATAEDCEVLKHYLGADKFDRVIQDFVNNAHSTHFNIGRYAAYLPAFLERHELGNAFGVELATLENAISQLTDPLETIPFEPHHLEGVTPEALMGMVLHPRKALQLFAFQYPVNAYFRGVKEDLSPQTPEPEQSFVAVFRHEDSVWRMDLEAAEHNLLKRLFQGLIIAEAMEGIDESMATKLSEYFSRWMRNGLLAHYESDFIVGRAA